MKVQATNIPNSQPAGERKKSPSFRAKPNWNNLGKDISKNSKKIPRFFTYVGQNDGEILNTLVTAVGTSVVAPIFIAGNPFSKEDKETKWYSAMRQPISAVIALVFQLYVNNVFNDWMAKSASTGYFGEFYDLSAAPKSKYLKQIIKMEHPEFNANEIEAEVLKRQSNAEKRKVGELRFALKDKPVEYKELVSKDSLDEAAKQLKVELEPKYSEELKNMSSKAKEKFFEKKLTPEMLEERAIANIKSAVEKEASAKFKIRELASKFNTVDDAIKYMKDIAIKEIKDEALINNVLDRLENIKVYEESQGMKAFSSIKDLGKTYDKVLNNVKIKRLVKAKTSDAQKAFSKLNKWLGILVSLVTLPFSCGLLNWAYPRVMEKVMPKLQPWIHRDDPNWSPETAKKYGPPEKIEKAKEAQKSKIEREEEDND